MDIVSIFDESIAMIVDSLLDISKERHNGTDKEALLHIILTHLLVK
jgi:hypothetical protein